MVANLLLGLPKYYIFEKSLKQVNTKALQSYFPKTIFHNAKNEEAADSLINFGTSTMMPTSIFDDYFFWRKKLEYFSFYDYLKIIS